MEKIVISFLIIVFSLALNVKAEVKWGEVSDNCFYTWPMEEGSIIAMAKKYKIKDWKDFHNNSGKYFGKNINNYENFEMTPNLQQCKLNKNMMVGNGFITKDEYTIVKAELLKDISTKYCNKLSPNLKENCEKLALFKITENSGGSWSPTYHIIYGIYSINNLEYLIPLKSFEEGTSEQNEEASLFYLKELQKENKKIEVIKDENSIDLQSEHEIIGDKVILTIKSKNLTSSGKGGISISFPQFDTTKRILKEEKIGFKDIGSYKKGTKIWNREIKKTVKSSYLLIEGWSKEWRENEEKIIKLTIDIKKLDKLIVNIRTNIVSGDKEYVNPVDSTFYNQQGYYDKVLNISLP